MLTSSRWELSTLIIITRNENLLNFLNLSVSAWFPRRLNWFNILMHDVLINMIWKLIQLGEKESRYPNFPPTPPLKWFSFCHFMIKIANRWLDKSFILIILLFFSNRAKWMTRIELLESSKTCSNNMKKTRSRSLNPTHRCKMLMLLKQQLPQHRLKEWVCLKVFLCL